MAVEYLDLLVDQVRDLTDALKNKKEAVDNNTTSEKTNTTAKENNTTATTNNTSAKNKSTVAFNDLRTKSAALGKEFLNIANAGVKFGTAVGTTATRGVEIEIRNRLAVASQLSNFNANLAVTVEQLRAAQTGFSDAFVGAAAGMQISSKGSIDFVRSLKEGFGSEFEPTAETFRILTQLGISTTEQFRALRVASGRAGLSANQLATLYNKNSLSFLLYGNSFAKAAVQAEQLGVNLAGIQSAQESLVTNLDGTIDTVAQINQLGGQIDFGNLIRVAEQEGPDALMAYVRATVPANLMQSASTRALFRQLGISVEDYIKSGGQQISAADQIQAKFTEAATETGKAAKALGSLGAGASKMSALVMGSFGTLAFSAYAAATALLKVAGAGGLAGMFSTGGFKTLGVGGSIMTGLGGLATGTVAGTALGGTGPGSLIGSVIGTVLGSFFGPGGMYVGGTLGGIAGGQIGKLMADDMFSAGYGSRTLVTPKGAFALNNADDIIAGTNLFPKGSLQMGSDSSELVRKVDNLISALSNATTTINVGGMTQSVPRMQLVGVYSRNEVR